MNGSKALGTVFVLFAAAALVSCGASSTPDPRCSIAAEGQHHRQIAKSINGSDLWQEFLESKTGRQVEIRFTAERQARRTRGGDYDPGTVTVDFKATSASNGKLLYKNDMRVALEPFMIGLFDKDATREQIQEIAFKATEEKVYPYLDRWVNISAIRAMGNEGSRGNRFVSTLNELIADKWTSSDMRVAAEEALQQIEG